MRFLVLKTTTEVTKELYELDIASYLDPLSFISNQEPMSKVIERDVKADVFRVEKEVENDDTGNGS